MQEHNNTLFYQGSSISSRIIYTPSPFAHSLLYLQEIGSLTALKPHVSGRDHLNSFLFFVVRSGSGWLEYKNERYELCEGDCVFISCAHGYAQSSSETLWQISWVHWSGASMPAIWNKYCERGGKCVFHPGDRANRGDRPDGTSVPAGTSGAGVYTSLLDNLYTTASSDDFLKDMHISELLVQLVTRIMEQTIYKEGQQPVSISTANSPCERIDVGQIKSYIDTHYNSPLSLSSIADHFHFNKNYTARILRSLRDEYWFVYTDCKSWPRKRIVEV